MAPKKASVKAMPKRSSTGSVTKVMKVKGLSTLASKAASMKVKGLSTMALKSASLKAKAVEDKLKAVALKENEKAKAVALKEKEKAKAVALKEKEKARVEREQERETVREEREKRKFEALEAKDMEDAIAQVAKFEAEEATHLAKRKCLEQDKGTEQQDDKEENEEEECDEENDEQQKAGKKEEAIDQWEVVFGGSVNVRAAADQNARILCKKASGSLVRGSQRGDWLALQDEPGFMLVRAGDIVAMEKKGQQKSTQEEEEDEAEEEDQEEEEEENPKATQQEDKATQKDQQNEDKEVIQSSQGADATGDKEIVEQKAEVSEGLASQNDDSNKVCKKNPDPAPKQAGNASTVVQLPSAAAKDLWKRRAKVFQDKTKMLAADNMWNLLPDIPGSSPVVGSNTAATSGDGDAKDENEVSKEADANVEAKDDEPVKQAVEKAVEAEPETRPSVFGRKATVEVGENKEEKSAAASTESNVTESPTKPYKKDDVDMWSLLPDVK